MKTLASLVKSADHYSVNTFYCRDLDLFAAIAIHRNMELPAIGGCRCLHYNNYEDAITDALILSSAMSQKSEFHKLNHGGGKMVVALPSKYNRSLVMQKIGTWVDMLSGAYITASDSGTNSEDMKLISSSTKHVASPYRWPEYKPSYYTALGVCAGIKSCANEITNKKVLVQGLGEVGKHLVEMLIAAGADVLVTDINTQRINEICAKFKVKSIPASEALTTKCDILAPCALGGILNPITIPNLKAKMVIGAANNQFSNPVLDAKLAGRMGIMVVPDYVVNAGGLIHVAGLYAGKNLKTIETEVLEIGKRARKFIQDKLSTC